MNRKKVQPEFLPEELRQELARLLEEKRTQNIALQKLILELDRPPGEKSPK